ncbi:oxygen-independent coproporphyrinogen III oxidase [Roseovarius sp. CH_XMU1461]|uniref:oxygen-independent coproporphyrinogen III oxidase n=1 Tax=Roseovarius sp. CH_XMU1461 TaxID=3107777 RepID=UPI00300BF45C
MTQFALASALRHARVPRYTSYPPANRFTPAVDGALASQWISEIPAGAALSLYIHVPFCRRLCWFCACRTQGTKGDAPIDRYLEHIALEIAQLRGRLGEGQRVERLHLGGGTPTILSPDRIGRLSDQLHKAFAIPAGAEISVEIDPCDCDDARVEALRDLGMNRVSIGVQDFDPRVQAAIGREQSIAATRALVESVRKRGVRSVNFDLVYGLPYQSEATLLATLETVIGLGPDRLALYGYAHVPQMARRQRIIPEAALPGPEARLALAARAREVLIEAGYVPVGIDHFARPQDALARAAKTGHLRRNFQGYTTDNTEYLIGLGPSAISSLPQGIAQNIAATGLWQARVAAGGPATSRGHCYSATDRLVACVIERLMCQGEVDLAEVSARHDTSLDSLLRRARKILRDMPGIGRLEGATLCASDSATVRLICACFDPGFEFGTDAYSQAS